MHKDPIKLKPNEVKSFKIKFRNTGGIDWLPTFALYQVGDIKFRALSDGEKSVSIIEQCKVRSFKSIDLSLRAPKKAGTYYF